MNCAVKQSGSSVVDELGIKRNGFRLDLRQNLVPNHVQHRVWRVLEGSELGAGEHLIKRVVEASQISHGIHLIRDKLMKFRLRRMTRAGLMSDQNGFDEVDLIRLLKIRSTSSDVHMPFSLGPRIESCVEPNSVVVRLCLRSVFRRTEQITAAQQLEHKRNSDASLPSLIIS